MRGLAVGALAAGLAFASTGTGASDWPQWLGPSRDGRSPDAPVFAPAGPVRLRVAWRRPLGAATAGVVVSGDRVVTLDSDGERASAVALSAADGSILWRTPLDAGLPDEERGPGSTPLVADGVAFVLSPACQLRALDLATGKAAWHVDFKAHFGSAPRLGCTSSPLLVGDTLVVQTAAPEERRVVALERSTGALAWSTTGIARANYSSPGWRTTAGEGEVLVHHTDVTKADAPRGGVSALHPVDGRLLWHTTLDRNWSWATPVPAGEDRVLLVTWNDAAAIEPPRGTREPSVAWRTDAFTAYVGTPVYHAGHLYGHGGDFLRCVRAADGTVAWQERTYPGSVALVDGHVVALSVTAGLLRVVEATPEAYRERARLEVLTPGARAETPPSVAGRRIFVRNDEEVVAVDVEG